MERDVDPRRLYWVGPATIVAAILAVWVARQLLLAILPPLPKWSGGILRSIESEVLTGVLVTGAVLIFAIVVEIASRPLRTFRRIALVVLIVSCVPNLAGQVYNRIFDSGLFGLMVLHFVAWGVTVEMLTRLSLKRQTAAADERENNLAL